MRELRSRLAPDAIVTYGAGNHCIWAQRYLPLHSYPSLLAPRNGAMGFGLPAAVAASIAHPGRQVVSVAGDGCFLMNGQELATAVAHGARPLVLVVDNSAVRHDRGAPGAGVPRPPARHGADQPRLRGVLPCFRRVRRTGQQHRRDPGALDRALASGNAAVLHLDADPTVLRPQPKG